jgi:hypothetical protein
MSDVPGDEAIKQVADSTFKEICRESKKDPAKRLTALEMFHRRRKRGFLDEQHLNVVLEELKHREWIRDFGDNEISITKTGANNCDKYLTEDTMMS